MRKAFPLEPGHRSLLPWVLLAALTIVALLLGVVAMHALTPQPQASETSHSHIAHDGTAPAAIISIETSASVSEFAWVGAACDGMCEMNCLIVGMICGLMLLAAVVGLLLLGRMSQPRLVLIRWRRVLRLFVSDPPFLPAPSLLTLSISRT